jgi:hypothetical protein
MAALEAANSIAQLPKAATDMMPITAVTEELLAFLKEAPPMASILANLVRFHPRPDTDTQAAPASADLDADADLQATPWLPGAMPRRRIRQSRHSPARAPKCRWPAQDIRGHGGGATACICS